MSSVGQKTHSHLLKPLDMAEKGGAEAERGKGEREIERDREKEMDH